MPILKSPEVHETICPSGLIMLRQEINRDLAREDYETDVGLNDFLGLNVLCANVHVYGPPVPNPAISLTMFLSEQWNRKDDELQRMRDRHGLEVSEERGAWGNPMTQLSVRGAENILSFGINLRASFEETAHEGASIFRHVVHPALLGEAMEAVGKIALSTKNRPAERGWVELAREYGWRP